MRRQSASSPGLRQIGKVLSFQESDFYSIENSGQCLTVPLKQLKRKRRAGPSVHDLLTLELDRLNHSPPQLSGNESLFMLGDIALLLSIRDEIHVNIQAVRTEDSNPYTEVKPLFVPHSENLKV
jgi:hypothetical protein